MSFSATNSPPPVDPHQQAPPQAAAPQPSPDFAPQPLTSRPLTSLRPPGSLAAALTVLLALCGLYALLMAGTGLYAGAVLRAGSYPGAGAEDGSTLPDTLMALTGLLEIPILIATAAVFVTWFHRVHHNARILGQDAVTRSGAWAIGGWFVPFAFLRIPYKMAKEIWTASLQRGPDGAYRHVSTAPITAWWLVWITALLASRVYDTLYGRAADADGLATAATAAAVYGVVLLAASVLAIRFVRGLTALQIAKGAEGPYAAE